MVMLMLKYVLQFVVYKVVVDGLLKKLRIIKDVFLLEVLKVIDNGNGKCYFCGRLFGKVRFFYRMLIFIYFFLL